MNSNLKKALDITTLVGGTAVAGGGILTTFNLIKDKKGIEIYTGNTPATLKLKSGAGFFSKARYQVTFEKVGYDKKVVPVEFKLNGWYFGNIIFGGPLGLLIIDPATGAMFKLETEFLNETLTKSVASVDTKELKLLDINNIPAEWRNHLVLVSK